MFTRTRKGLVCLPVFFVLAFASRAGAETFRCVHGDPGCLIASMAKANANGPGHDSIVLGPGTYQLTRVDNESIQSEGPNGLPVNTGALTIYGEAGQGQTLITRAPDAPFFRIFDNARTGGLTLSGVTVMQGELNLRFLQHGGCIHNSGSMMVIDSTISTCAAWQGGGIESTGELLLWGTIVTKNFAEFVCGGVAGLGTTIIARRSWIGDSGEGGNVAETGAGVCGGDSSPLIIDDSVVDGNVATLGAGGGVEGGGRTTITQTLISENFAGYRGGGVYHFGGGVMTLKKSTLWDNAAEIDGGGLYVEAGEALLQDVAVLFNAAGIPELDFGSGGGIYTTAAGLARLERVWLLFNAAVNGAECSGNVQLDGWAVIGTPNQFHPSDQPPCE